MKALHQPIPGQVLGNAFRVKKSASVDHTPTGKQASSRSAAPVKPKNQVLPPSTDLKS